MDYLDYIDELQQENEELYHERVHVVRRRRDPYDIYTEIEFNERFGFRKESFMQLLTILDPELRRNSDRNSALSSQLQLLCALRIFRTGTFQLVAGDLINIHRTTAGRVFHRVVNALVGLRGRYINMPANAEECSECKRQFYTYAGFPQIIGAIDCTHIPIMCPSSEHSEIFRNRKGYFSINTQVISDATMRIANIVCRWPGSTHDARIWDNSAVASNFEHGLYNGMLVGDNGYACTRYLMTPLMHPVTPSEHQYNHAQAKTRNIVERLFGVWKKIFQILEKEMRFTPTRCANAIVATAVLHNFGLDVGDIYIEDFPNNGNENDQYVNFQVNAAGNAVRQAVINEYFS